MIYQQLPVTRVCFNKSYSFHHSHSIADATKYCMFTCKKLKKKKLVYKILFNTDLYVQGS